MRILFFLLCALFLTAAGCTNSNETGKIFMEKNALLIDVRTPEEFQQGSLPRALNLPLDTVETQISSVAPDKKTPLYLYCRSGRRSGIAVEKLAQMGYTTLCNLGGFQEAGEKLASGEK
jgi:phage shock protein E